MRRKRAARPPSTMRNDKVTERTRMEEDGAIARRRVQALDLAIGGASYRQIAKATGVSLATAFDDVQAELTALNELAAEKREHYRQLMLSKLDKWTLQLTPKAQRGDVQAVRALIAIEERRAKLLGTDAPTKTELSGGGGLPLSFTIATEKQQANG